MENGLDGFAVHAFSHDETTRDVYRLGSGPGVVLMHELPGPTDKVIAFGRRVADAGFTVVMPHLFGTPGRPASTSYLMKEAFKQVCINREFRALSAGEASPITEWLRALCRALHAELGGPGVGAIGMCLTGNFALALMVDDAVMAPVLSQPSLPLPIGRERKAGLHVSDEALARIKERVADGVKVLGLRFTHDRGCPPERFDHLRRELGDGFEAIEIDSGPDNRFGIPRSAHCVLTEHLVDREGHPTRAALDRVLAFFAEKLR